MKTTKKEEVTAENTKIVDEETAYWIQIKERTEHEIKQLNNLLKFNAAILEMCKDKLKSRPDYIGFKWFFNLIDEDLSQTKKELEGEK